MRHLRGVLALGGTAHNAVLRAHGLRPARLPFRHGSMNALPGDRVLADSYHVSRLNTNTGRLTELMFRSVVAGIARQDGDAGLGTRRLSRANPFSYSAPAARDRRCCDSRAVPRNRDDR